MSLETLLNSLSVPQVPSVENARELQDTALIKARSPGTPSSPGRKLTLNETLTAACHDLTIIPVEVRNALGPEDIDDWHNGDLSIDTLKAFAKSLEQRREMDQGIVPTDFTERATCTRCGPVWLWFAGEVLGCPWCWNRVAGKPIPRPSTVRCVECIHYERIGHPHLGHCAINEPEAIAGIWDTAQRLCNKYLPRQQGDHHAND